MALKRILIPTAFVVGALALSVACAQVKPTATATSVPGGSTPTVATDGSANGGTSTTFPGAGKLEAAGFTTYAAPQVSGGYQQAGIWVGGSGKVVVTPDLATLSVGVEATEKTVEQARSEAAQAMNAIMDALKKNGIADKDIRTQYYNIQPQYVWNDSFRRQELTGYHVTNSLTAKSRDIDGVGALLDAVTKAGGNYTRVSGVNFSAEHPEVYANQAREAAVKDAMSKAQQFATLTGVKLGKLQYIAETGGNVPVYQEYAKLSMAAADMGAAPTPISAGEMDVTVTVQAVFGIE